MKPAVATSADPLRADLAELVRLSEAARQLQLRPGVVRARQAGQYVSRLRGRGMEFDESRPYQPGDDVRNMDWRVTARIGKPYSKLFREERERPVLIAVDARAPMFFATRGRFKWVRAQQTAALLAWTAFQAGDRVGGEIFAESSHLELRPRRGKARVLRFLKALANQPPSRAQAPVSLEAPLRRMHRTAHPGSLVALVSDFRGFDAAAERWLIRLARHNDLVLVQIHDPLEARLPESGRYRISDGRRALTLDTGARALQRTYQARYRERVEHLRTLCRQHRMTWLSCATAEDPVAVLRRVYGRSRG